MDYRGPLTSDYDNIRVLNAGLLALPGLNCATSSWLAPLDARLAARLAGLRARGRQRLAQAPLLLFSIRELPEEAWSAAPKSGSLFEAQPAADEVALTSAALGFVWQLARSNPYAARLTCGGSLHFCEQIADRPLYEVVNLAVSARLLTLRRADDLRTWQLLLDGGIAADRNVREATHMAVLQRVLMTPGTSARPVQRAARNFSGGPPLVTSTQQT